MSPAIWIALIELAASIAKDVIQIVLHTNLTDAEKEDEINKLVQRLHDMKRRVGEVEL